MYVTISRQNSAAFLFNVLETSKAMEHINIPVKFTDLDDGQDKWRMESWPVMDPHSIAAFLLEHAGLQIPETSLRQYWEHNRIYGEEWAQNANQSALPVGLYGDSARVVTRFGHMNLAGIYFNFVLWKPQSVRMSRFLICTIPENMLWHHFTMNAILRRVAWSINALVDGFHPSQGPYNEQLPPHLSKHQGKPLQKCLLTEVRGDWSWHKKIFRFANRCAWNGLRVCHHCPALSQSQNPQDLYWSFNNNTWDDNHFSFDQWINERMPASGMCFPVEF